MTTPLEKPVVRLLTIRNQAYVVELSRAGVLFRVKGRRQRLVAPMGLILALAERLAGEDSHREQLRAKALRRIGR